MTLWHIDPWLCNDSVTNNKITASVRQQLRKYATVLKSLLRSGLCATMEVLLGMVFLMSQLRGYITRPTQFEILSAMQYSGASAVE
jgi:hypothetical protein